MNFLERILSRIEHSSDPLDRISNWIAENLSRQPAVEDKMNYSFLPHYKSAREAEMVLFLSLFLPDWETWEIKERISQSCYFQHYVGEWSNVQQWLHKVTNSETLEEYISTHMSFDDFFGNFLRECNRFLRRNPQPFRPTVRDERKPRRLVRHRGYRDKGTLRPYDKRGRNIGESNKGEDHRTEINYKTSFRKEIEEKIKLRRERFERKDSVQERRSEN